MAQNLPKNRAEACSKEVLEDFFTKLENVVKRCKLEKKPTHIFNCDESGFQTDAGLQKNNFYLLLFFFL